MPFPTGDTQICRDCGLDLPIGKFSRNGRKDGYRRPECRSCQHIRSKAINPQYTQTPGTVANRLNHDMPASAVAKIRAVKVRAQNGECIYCDAKISDMSSHLDHILPLSKGGENDPGNLQALCSRCNAEKHSKSHTEYLIWLSQVGETTTRGREKLAPMIAQIR